MGWLLWKIHIYRRENLNDIDDADDIIIIIIIIIVLAVLFIFCLLSQRVHTEVLERVNWNKQDKVKNLFWMYKFYLWYVYSSTWSVAMFLFVDIKRTFRQ